MLLNGVVFGLVFAVTWIVFGTITRGFTWTLILQGIIPGLVAFAAWALLASRVGRGKK
jgi:lipopolysaccharide export LptBFGC system permease protein LptF